MNVEYIELFLNVLMIVGLLVLWHEIRQRRG